MNIILFNGPPGCGKDTAALCIIARFFAAKHTFRFERMSFPNKRAFAGTVNAAISPLGHVVEWEDRKDEPSLLLNGKTYRDWQIEYSEKFMKPLYGDAIFGRLLAERIKHRADDHDYTVLVPDCGFPIEALQLRKEFPKAGILLVRIYRTGFDFSKDSRGYIVPTPEMGLTIVDLDNDGSQQEFEIKVERTVRDYLGC